MFTTWNQCFQLVLKDPTPGFSTDLNASGPESDSLIGSNMAPMFPAFRSECSFVNLSVSRWTLTCKSEMIHVKTSRGGVPSCSICRALQRGPWTLVTADSGSSPGLWPCSHFPPCPSCFTAIWETRREPATTQMFSRLKTVINQIVKLGNFLNVILFCSPWLRLKDSCSCCSSSSMHLGLLCS